MPFSARDLRYRMTETYPMLLDYLNRQAQHFLGPLKYDTAECEIVAGHVVEQLVKLGLCNGGDVVPLTYLDVMSDLQFYAFLKSSVRNKAIDRLRKRRIQATHVEGESLSVTGGARESEDDPFKAVTVSLWGSMPFQTPEHIIVHAVEIEETRAMLVHCIKELCTAQRQKLAILHELQEFDALEIMQKLLAESGMAFSPDDDTPLAHESQHKDHAHRKLRHCLQQLSSNLIVRVILRLIECKVWDADSQLFTVAVPHLIQADLAESDVVVALTILAAKGLIDWQHGQALRFTAAQSKRLGHYYVRE